MKKKVLFLCTGNSCRSQMAEGFLRHLRGDAYEVYSAGVDPSELNPKAVQVMEEAGVDISKHTSKRLEELLHIQFDLVITVCDNARQSCPVFPGKARVIHKGFDDPPKEAAGARSPEEALEPFRRVRDEIRAFVETLPRTHLTSE